MVNTTFDLNSSDRESQFREAAAIMLRTLGHPDRLRILQMLMVREHTMGEVQRELGFSQPRTSQHLSRMYDRGILDLRKDGTRRFYSVSNPFVQKLFGCFSECSVKVSSGEWEHLLDSFSEVNRND